MAREAIKPVGILAVLAVVLGALGLAWAAWVLAAAALAVGLFFRDPPRAVVAMPSQVLSPADGRIVAVDRRREDRFLKGEALRISVFMSVFNVHINRVPFDCRVLEARHVSGGFAMAHLDEVGLENERTEILLQDERGGRSLMVQVAGLVARRIICRLEPGDEVKAGSRFGLICFGSRVDLYLPPDAIPSVSVGDRVRGGLTVLAGR